MSTASKLVETAFERLAARSGFVSRRDQLQLAMLLSDLIEGSATGVFEAPTGLGKSLAALVPAIAHGIADGRRTVIATYTNVLAEQYWRNDLPLALSLFDTPESAKTEFLIGRQKFACLTALEEHAPDVLRPLMACAELGIESEFRQTMARPPREMAKLWPQVTAPPVCPARLCPQYDACFYYRRRRSAERAHVVITNHSVVLQDALMGRASEQGQGMLGEFDFLILDEAHDFAQAAAGGLEFELSAARVGGLASIVFRMEKALAPLAATAGESREWFHLCEDLRKELEKVQRALAVYGETLDGQGILVASPPELMGSPGVKACCAPEAIPGAEHLAGRVADALQQFCGETEGLMTKWRAASSEASRLATDSAWSYASYLGEFAGQCERLLSPTGVCVTHASNLGADVQIRQDAIGLAEPLRELIWTRTPWACLSATLAIDGTFDYFVRSTGAEPEFKEILPSPFDFTSQAAAYIPKPGAIPDPTAARREGSEDRYYRAVASELSKIIGLMGGRTLALFHSRREMEGVASYMELDQDLPLFLQHRSGAAISGEKFVRNVRASLFALRSFWTGFDAPGETLSCVALVRVPFEVPTEPPQIARMAWMQSQGLDPFSGHTLPLAKMIMRQGAGRLIRRADDKGLIALLDPRLRTKRYGEEIVLNLPRGMRVFDDVADAIGWVGLLADGAAEKVRSQV